MGSLSRRRFLQVLNASAAGIAASEWMSIVPAYAEDQMTLANTGSIFGETIFKQYITVPGFEAKHGTKVAVERAVIGVRVAKTLAKCGNPDFTAVATQNIEAVQLAEAGCLAPYDLNVVTNFKDLLKAGKEGPRKGMEAWFGGSMLVVASMVWNTKEASKPTKWEDLLSAKYDGRIGIPAAGWFGPVWLNAVNKYLGGSETDLTKGFEFLAEIKKRNPVVMENPDHAMKSFTRGEVVMAPFWNGRCFQLQEQKVPVEITYVPGSVQATDGFVLTKGSRFYGIANDFINNLFNPELQVAVTRVLKYPPTNSKAKLPPEIEHYGIKPSDLDNLVSLDYGTIAKARDQFIERWNRTLFS